MTRHSWTTMCTTAMMALAVTAAIAGPAAGQGRGRGRGQAPPPPPAHIRFDDNDRRVTYAWYGDHQRNPPAGFRSRDRFAPDVEVQFREGYVLDRRQRGQAHSVPSTLLRLLFPAPRGYRYVVINDHLILIDGGFRVFDVIHVGHGR
jgi:hypothetical protein